MTGAKGDQRHERRVGRRRRSGSETKEDEDARHGRQPCLERDRAEHRRRRRDPVRRIATTRAAGVQTPPGTYFASIETISACSAIRYETWMSSSRRIQIQPRTKSR